MIKMILVFVTLTGLIGVGFKLFQALELTQKMSVLKTLYYSAACSFVAVVILFAVVEIF